MRITFFVTLVSLSSWAQFGLNGQVATQTGFTRTQLERQVGGTGTTANTPGTTTIIYANASANSCFKTACFLAGTFGCDDQDEIIGLTRACRGQTTDECLIATCKGLGEFACDEYQEVRRLAANCGSDGNP